MTNPEDAHQNVDEGKSGLSHHERTRTHVRNSSGHALLPHHPKQIGKYTLRRVIASGGMGTVFEGVQDNPRRSVAIKVVKGGDVSDKMISRLKYEAQMLARLHHPGIAEIYEAGTYEEHGTEVPFFAMEYISNAKTISEYAASRKLTIEQKLELFLQVCDAVNYGHQRGIVHRDLKPDNILVDSQNRVRIIDFGLAKATDSDLQHTQVQTEVGQIVGSLKYMSPEQFDTDSSDLDTRSDVYSLGVVLYELISGQLPYDLDGKKLFEIAGIIREKEPRSLSKSGQGVPAEVEIILQKALMKERELRYQTAFGLKQDINRFLSGDAIVARSLSLTYQIKVFTRKNKLLVGSLASAFVLLIAGVVASTTLLVRVSDERERALIESERAQKAHVFMTNVFETAIPIGYGKPVEISRVLDESTKMLETAFPDDPEVESDIRRALGLGYMKLSKFRESREHLEKALDLRIENLGTDHPKSVASLEDLLSLNQVAGDYKGYLGNCQELCRIDSVAYGAADPITIDARLSVIGGLETVGRIAEGLEMVQQVRELCVTEYPDNVKMLCEVDQYWSWLLLQDGQLGKALEVARTSYERASARLSDVAFVTECRSGLAAALIANGELQEAVELYGNYPTYPDLDREYDLIGEFDPSTSDIHLIIFWEEWCPYCDRMMSRAEDLYRQYRSFGIDVVGITNLWKPSTREDAERFLRNHSITFPNIKEAGKAFDHFNAPGVPAVRLVYQGKLIWEKRVPSVEPISRHMLEGIVKARQSLVTR